jgi:hypothetical protein
VTIALPPDSCKVYTPYALASAMVCALGDAPDAQWLEPSHGHGVFLKAIAELGVDKSRAYALDLDSQVQDADALATTFRGVDFLEWAIKTKLRFDRIVGNPPYVAIKRLPPALRRMAAMVIDADGSPLGAQANTWYAFMVSAIRLLRDEGELAFVLPSAAEYADYAFAARGLIRERFRSVELYRCRRPLFEGVQEGTVVVVARGYGRGPGQFRRREFPTAAALLQSVQTKSPVRGRPCPPPCDNSLSGAEVLGEIADIRLGGVTGDANFFLLTEERRLALQLPDCVLTPVVSKARHLQGSVVGKSEWQRLRASQQRVWLFRPNGETATIPAVKRYLEMEYLHGGCKRDAYKIRSRTPWYATPLPERPHAFMSGMTKHGPWMCFNGIKALNATNTLYVVTFRENIGRTLQFMYALAFFSSPAQRQMRRTARRYADGLLKQEPSGVTTVRLPRMRHIADPEIAYASAVSALLSGRPKLARSIADVFLKDGDR